MYRVLIVCADFYRDLAAELIRGARSELDRQGCTWDLETVPGALEIPAAISIVSRRDRVYDGFVALGCVIRGETSHYDIVAGESARGLIDLAITRELAIGNGILTVDTAEQARVRAGVEGRNKGRDAVLACLSLIRLKQGSVT